MSVPQVTNLPLQRECFALARDIKEDILNTYNAVSKMTMYLFGGAPEEASTFYDYIVESLSFSIDALTRVEEEYPNFVSMMDTLARSKTEQCNGMLFVNEILEMMQTLYKKLDLDDGLQENTIMKKPKMEAVVREKYTSWRKRLLQIDLDIESHHARVAWMEDDEAVVDDVLDSKDDIPSDVSDDYESDSEGWLVRDVKKGKRKGASHDDDSESESEASADDSESESEASADSSEASSAESDPVDSSESESVHAAKKQRVVLSDSEE